MPSSTIWRRSQYSVTVRGDASPHRPSTDEIERLSPEPSLEPFLYEPQPRSSDQENGDTLRGLGLSLAGLSDAPVTVLHPDHLYLDQDGAAHLGARVIDSAASQSHFLQQSPEQFSNISKPKQQDQYARNRGHTRSGSTIADLANAAIATSPAPTNSSPYSHWKGASHTTSRPSTSYIQRHPHDEGIDGPPAKRIKSERIGSLEWSSAAERPMTSGFDDSTSMKDAMLLLSLRNEINFKNTIRRLSSTSTYPTAYPNAPSPPPRLSDTQVELPAQPALEEGSLTGDKIEEISKEIQHQNQFVAHAEALLNNQVGTRPRSTEPNKRKRSKAAEPSIWNEQQLLPTQSPPDETAEQPSQILPPKKKLKLELNDPEDDVRCAACQHIEPERVDDEEKTLWIQCGPCKRWYHAHCVGYKTKSEVESVNAYVCQQCEPMHGKTTYVRKSSRPRTNIDYDALNQGVVKSAAETSTHHYIQPFKDGKFPLLPDDFARIRPEMLTVEFMENSTGMKRPFVVPAAWNPRFGVQMSFAERDPVPRFEQGTSSRQVHFDVRGNIQKPLTPSEPDPPTEEVVNCGQDLLDMVIPKNLTVRRVAELYGLDEPVPVIDVKTQETKGQYTLQQWADYYELSGDKPIRNVISLEVSQSPLGKLIRRPKVVRDLDLEDHVWDIDTETRTKKRPVQFYCLMSVADSYTDFHIDFGGSSVYYHILKGTKTFFFIPPEDKFLKKYENWCNSDTQNETWLGGLCENNCIRVDLHEGDTAFIPAGWIHSVWTPEDSLVIGGNFLTRIDYEMQLKVANIEKVTKVAAKFRYPYFQKVMWYALIKYLEEDPVPEEIVEEFREDPDYVYLRANPTWHEVEELENVAEPGTPDFNARFYPRSEVSGWPALRDYLYRTARIDAGLPVSEITKKQVDAVRASIPKGHGEALTMIKVFAIWCAWKIGNVTAPEWLHSDGALEADKIEKMKKPETFRLPGERSSSRRAAQIQNQARSSPVEASAAVSKQISRSTSKGSGLRVACEPCRKRRIKCRHKSGSETPTRAAPEIRPRSFSSTEMPTAAPTYLNGNGMDLISSPEARLLELGGGSDASQLTLGNGDPGSSSKKSRSKACEECRKSKRRCVHDEYGRVDPAKAAEPSKPRGSTNSKRPARLSDGSLQQRNDSAIFDDLIDPALTNGHDVPLVDASVEDYYLREQQDEIRSQLSREDTKMSETEAAANLQLIKELEADQFPIDPALEAGTVDIKPELDPSDDINFVSDIVEDTGSNARPQQEFLTPTPIKTQSSLVNGDFSGALPTAPQSGHSSRQSKHKDQFTMDEKKSPSKLSGKSLQNERRGSSAASGQTEITSGKSRRSSSNTSRTTHQMANISARRSASIGASARPVSRGSTAGESDIDADEKFARELQAAENGLRRRTSMRA